MTSPGLRRVNSLALHLPEKTAPGELFHIINTVMNDDDVKCVQHLSDAKWIVTCASTLARDKLYGATLKINEKHITATAADGSTAFVNVFFAPQELSDPAIITKLSQYRRVLGCRRGHWQTQPGWENGIRHLRMEIKTAIPSFVRVGPHQLMIKYEGQQPTCRTCGEPRPPRSRMSIYNLLQLRGGRAPKCRMSKTEAVSHLQPVGACSQRLPRLVAQHHQATRLGRPSSFHPGCNNHQRLVSGTIQNTSETSTKNRHNLINNNRRNINTHYNIIHGQENHLTTTKT